MDSQLERQKQQQKIIFILESVLLLKIGLRKQTYVSFMYRMMLKKFFHPCCAIPYLFWKKKCKEKNINKYNQIMEKCFDEKK